MSRSTNKTTLNHLPTELVTSILCNLSAKDLTTFSRTNKKFQEVRIKNKYRIQNINYKIVIYQIADSDYLWKPWCKQWDVSALDTLLIASNSNWKKFATEFGKFPTLFCRYILATINLYSSTWTILFNSY
jgi:hypothetical protein